MAEVGLKGVRKQFGALPVIQGVDLNIDNGEFIVLVGPSGCGKSTLLRMIAGLESISQGEISIGGTVVNNLEPRERDIAMVFQSYALYPHMSVAKNMGFSMSLRGVDEKEIDATVKGAAAALRLDEYLDRLPKALSGGQRQRVAMGRAIVRKPKVFLFDEPLSNLDAQLRVQMRTEVRKLHQQMGATSIYVTHDQVEAMTMADRIVVLDKGRIAQVGTPLELYDAPANRFVAEFIGSPSINFIQSSSKIGETHAPDALGLSFTKDAAGSITVGIRPEHFHPVSEGGITGSIQVVEHLGAETYVFLDAGLGKDICWRVAGRPAVAIGERISLGADVKDIHLFDTASGARVQTLNYL